MPSRLVITRTLPSEVEIRARGLFDVSAPSNPNQVLTLHRASLDGADAILPSVADPLPRAVIDALPDTVKIIANFGVGTDHIDLGAAADRGIKVTNTPGVLTDATADIAMLLILSITRRAREGAEMLQSGDWSGWTPTQLMGVGLGGRRLGIIGMGRIGRVVAKRAQAFGMKISYHGRNRLPPEQEDGAIFCAALTDLLAQSDVVSLHCAATAETRDLIDARALAAMKAGAYLINTARGDIVSDDAVIAALDRGHLEGVGLDVFKGEPKVDPRYLGRPNAVLLPHMGSATEETRTAMGMLALDNLQAYFAGAPLPNEVVPG